LSPAPGAHPMLAVNLTGKPVLGQTGSGSG
jgi:hypothetical protein